MPDSPRERDQLNSLDIIDGRPDAHGEQRHRSDHKANFETIKQCSIAISANHSWQVMAHRAECADKQKNVLCTPSSLRRRKNWDEQQGRSDEEDKVTPAIEDPGRRSRARGGAGWR